MKKLRRRTAWNAKIFPGSERLQVREPQERSFEECEIRRLEPPRIVCSLQLIRGQPVNLTHFLHHQRRAELSKITQQSGRTSCAEMAADSHFDCNLIHMRCEFFD